MNENGKQRVPTPSITSTTVVSREGAVIRVERINLSDEARRSLTTGVASIGGPRVGRRGGWWRRRR